MALMGLRVAQRANGVSLLHGEVSREMFAGLWPNFDPADVPITSVTNGVHAPTWVSREVQQLVERDLGVDLQADGAAWAGADHLDDRQLWEVRRALRSRLVDETRVRLRASWLQRGAMESELGWIDDVLDPDVLTIGFARRVPSYKRLTLMLQDPKRFTAMLLDHDRPVQFVIAGKAHPADDGGKRLIQEVVRFADGAGRAAPGRVPARLRHGAGTRAVRGRRRLAEQPAAAARGMRHLGHEGRLERCAEPVDSRRLVGRVVRRRQRVGDPVGRRASRGAPRRDSRRARSTTSSRPRWCRASTTMTVTVCRSAGSKWCGTRCRRSARRSSRPACCATT